MMLPDAVGDETANLALRILNGESVSSIPITPADVIRPIFDWRQLQRWGVDQVRLPHRQ